MNKSFKSDLLQSPVEAWYVQFPASETWPWSYPHHNPQLSYIRWLILHTNVDIVHEQQADVQSEPEQAMCASRCYSWQGLRCRCGATRPQSATASCTPKKSFPPYIPTLNTLIRLLLTLLRPICTENLQIVGPGLDTSDSLLKSCVAGSRLHILVRLESPWVLACQLQIMLTTSRSIEA